KLKAFICPSDPGVPPLANGGGGGVGLGFHYYNWSGLYLLRLGMWYDDYIGVEQYQPFGPTNYAAVGGMGVGNYPAIVAGYPPIGNLTGVGANRVDISIGQVSSLDGTSNVLHFGERCGMNWSSANPP